MERINYNGPKETKALHAWAAKQSKSKKYVLVSVVFGDVIASRWDKLPSSDHAANDWRGGYWYDGQRKEWSEARKIKAQNAGQTND